MRKALLLAMLSLPLVAGDCGGDDDDRSATGCTLRAGGETLVCQAVAFDYGALDPSTTEWAFEIVGARPDGTVMVSVQLFLPARPVIGATYGWSATSSNVDHGWGERSVISAQAPSLLVTHEATPPFFEPDDGVGAVSVRFSRIPPPGTSQAEVLLVDGTLEATLVATDGSGAALSVRAAF